MVTGVSLQYVVNLIGHKRSTRTKEIVAVFRQLGFKCPDRLVVLRSKPVADLHLAVVKITFPHCRGSTWHWVAVHQGRMFDPSPANAAEYGRPTSYLPLTL
jgi:hypothetical protein